MTSPWTMVLGHLIETWRKAPCIRAASFPLSWRNSPSKLKALHCPSTRSSTKSTMIKKKNAILILFNLPFCIQMMIGSFVPWLDQIIASLNCVISPTKKTQKQKQKKKKIGVLSIHPVRSSHLKPKCYPFLDSLATMICKSNNMLQLSLQKWNQLCQIHLMSSRNLMLWYSCDDRSSSTSSSTWSSITTIVDLLHQNPQ